MHRNCLNSIASYEAIITGAIVVAVVVSCLNASPSAVSGATQSILTDAPCAPPCWYEIAPGTVMEQEEVIQIVEQMPNVGSVWESTTGAVDWTWEQWPWEGTGYNHIFSTAGAVQSISLSIDFELTVEQILAKYGLPETTHAVRAGLPDYPNYVAMFLCYPTQGVYFTAWLELFQPAVEPTSRVYRAVFTAPYESLESWESSLGYDTLRAIHLQPWPGYGPLDEEAYDLHLP
jgi:hypothetical protein